MCVLGMAKEFKDLNIGVNALWPRTAILTAAIEMLTGPDSNQFSRKPEIMADAAYSILIKEPKDCSGNFYIDEEVLKTVGISDLKQYACVPENADKLMTDFFLDVDPTKIVEFAQDGSHVDQIKNEGGEQKQIPGLFKKIEVQINEEVLKRTNAIFQFNVKGDEAGTWFLDLKNAPGKCGQGEPENPPDATLTMDSKNFLLMFSGKMKPASAFMTGKLKISGDMQKAMKLEKLMNALKAKL